MKVNNIIILLLFFVACSKTEESSDFITTEKGFKFKHCIENKTSPKVKNGDIILGEIEIRQNDSVLYSNFGSPDRLFKVTSDTVSEFDKLLLNMHIGDSVIIEPPIDTIVPHLSNIITKPGDKIRFYIKVHQIISQKELSEHDKQVKANQEIEDSVLNIFVAENYPLAERKKTGLYILEHIKTNNAKAEFGKTVSVFYSVSDTTGKVLDTNMKDVAKKAGIYNDNQLYQAFEFVLGDDGLIAGWTEGISYMREGERLKVLIPSKKAYGEAGYGAIAPYTPLIFNIYLNKVNN